MYARAGARQSFFEKEPSPSHCPAESPGGRAFPPSGARRQPSRILHGCFIARKTVSVFSETVSVFRETVSVFSETVSVFQETATALSAESMRQNSAVGISSFLIYISHSSFLISHLTAFPQLCAESVRRPSHDLSTPIAHAHPAFSRW